MKALYCFYHSKSAEISAALAELTVNALRKGVFEVK